MEPELPFQFDKKYKDFINDLKIRIRTAQMSAALAVNHEVIQLYWHIGKQIIEKQTKTNWGSKLLETLSKDLQNAFPETRGFSKRNLEFMRQFSNEYPDKAIVKQAVSQLPWGHIIILIQKVKSKNIREWYAQQTIKNGWSRHTLERFITQDLYKAQAVPDNKASNFLTRLPYPQATLAQDILKSPYNFDFLGLHDKAHEREIEHASIEYITKFLLELGRGFSFVGKQVPIAIQDEEFFIDMLFYHLKLHAYVVIELKSGKFKPEFAGKLNFYLNLVDDYFKTKEDNPTIGLLLCKSRKKVVAEYSLKGVEKPIGISEYQLTKAIPDDLKASLPTIAEIEAELSEQEK